MIFKLRKRLNSLQLTSFGNPYQLVRKFKVGKFALTSERWRNKIRKEILVVASLNIL